MTRTTAPRSNPTVIANTPFEERYGQFSPDGRWVAYATNETGRFEIVVQPFPEPSNKWQVSTGGGLQPRWRADGMELYFISPDGMLMASSVTANKSELILGSLLPYLQLTSKVAALQIQPGSSTPSLVMAGS